MLLGCLLLSEEHFSKEQRRKIMYTKRVKSGLAISEQHLKRMDENLRRAQANSRNDFVEQAIDHYTSYLNAEDSSQYIGELLSAELDRRLAPFAKTFSTNQYGINGTYDFSETSVSKTKIGKMFPYFNDVEVTVDSEGSKINREMYIGGMIFRICSVFPYMGQEKKTPTEQLIKYMDSEK